MLKCPNCGNTEDFQGLIRVWQAVDFDSEGNFDEHLSDDFNKLRGNLFKGYGGKVVDVSCNNCGHEFGDVQLKEE